MIHICLCAWCCRKGSVVTIDNRQSTKVTVNLIECGAGFCNGATFIFKNAEYLELKCTELIGCGAGCMVVDSGSSPVPCDQVMTV